MLHSVRLGCCERVCLRCLSFTLNWEFDNRAINWQRNGRSAGRDARATIKIAVSCLIPTKWSAITSHNNYNNNNNNSLNEITKWIIYIEVIERRSSGSYARQFDVAFFSTFLSAHSSVNGDDSDDGDDNEAQYVSFNKWNIIIKICVYINDCPFRSHTSCPFEQQFIICVALEAICNFTFSRCGSFFFSFILSFEFVAHINFCFFGQIRHFAIHLVWRWDCPFSFIVLDVLCGIFGISTLDAGEEEEEEEEGGGGGEVCVARGWDQ